MDASSLSANDCTNSHGFLNTSVKIGETCTDGSPFAHRVEVSAAKTFRKRSICGKGSLLIVEIVAIAFPAEQSAVKIADHIS
jgi:hypothetical protein